MNQQTVNQTPIQITLDLRKTATHSPIFDAAFQRAVASAFATLGEPAQRVLFRCLESDFSIPKKNVSADPAAFAKALEKIFGPAAAWLIEARIIQILHHLVPDFKYAATDGELLFLDYVEALTSFL
jgi:hypothetical protein